MQEQGERVKRPDGVLHRPFKEKGEQIYATVDKYQVGYRTRDTALIADMQNTTDQGQCSIRPFSQGKNADIYSVGYQQCACVCAVSLTTAFPPLAPAVAFIAEPSVGCRQGI